MQFFQKISFNQICLLYRKQNRHSESGKVSTFWVSLENISVSPGSANAILYDPGSPNWIEKLGGQV